MLITRFIEKMKVRPNHCTSIAISVSCFYCIAFFSDVHAFAGVSRRRFVSPQKATSKSNVAFVACGQPRDSRDVFFYAAASSDDDDRIEEESDEYEYVYEYEEEEEEEEDKEEENEEEEPIEIQDDNDDPNYMTHKALIEASIERREGIKKLKDLTSGEGADEFLKSNIEAFLDDQLKEGGVTSKEVDEIFRDLEVSQTEAKEAINQENKRLDDMSDFDKKEALVKDLGSAPDAYPPEGEALFPSDGETYSVMNEDLNRMQKNIEDLVGATRKYDADSLTNNKIFRTNPEEEMSRLDKKTRDEIIICLDGTATNDNGVMYGEQVRSQNPLRWLLYDLNFNVTNLMLASCKHNPNAPIILNHWMPQLCAYSRYGDVRERGFEFTWDDCEDVDMDELLRYYQGLGYDEIPKFKPKDTNIVDIDTEYDDDIRKAAALEVWMEEVYNNEDEDLYFDDESFQPENNVYDRNFGTEESNDDKGFLEEYEKFKLKYENATQEFKDMYAKERNFTLIEDEEEQKEFRGCLVVACTGSEKDLDTAEKITLRMKREFGKKVHVETRVMAHAREEDMVFEIWMEGFDVELLHSKRKTRYDADNWDGPPEVDDAQLEYLVDRVGYMISDDCRYSYNLHEFEEVA